MRGTSQPDGSLGYARTPAPPRSVKALTRGFSLASSKRVDTAPKAGSEYGGTAKLVGDPQTSALTPVIVVDGASLRETIQNLQSGAYGKPMPAIAIPPIQRQAEQVISE